MIKLARIKKGLSQNQLARKLHVDQSYISRVEKRNITTISVQFVLDISKELSLCPTDVFIFLMNDKCRSCNKIKCKYKNNIMLE